MKDATFEVGDRVVLMSYDPFVRQALVGEKGVVIKVSRKRAMVQFDNDGKPRSIHLGSLGFDNGGHGARPTSLPTGESVW